MSATMKRIRVLRLLEYTYDTPEAFVADTQRWVVQGTVVHQNVTIKSAVLPPTILEEEPKPKKTLAELVAWAREYTKDLPITFQKLDGVTKTPTEERDDVAE